MKPLLQWLTASGTRMALAAAILSLLPLLGLLSQSIIVLAVLMHGFSQGLAVAILVTAVTALPIIAAGGASAGLVAMPVLGPLLVLALAAVLARSRSLSLAAQVATIAVAAGVGLSFALGDPVQYWTRAITANAALLPEQFQQLRPGVSEIATGAMGLMVLLGAMLALFIGRWWQSVLQRPGAFAEEFRSLRLGLVIALLAAAVFIGAGLTEMTPLKNITLVLATAFLLQGLAVVHAVVAHTGNGTFWLVSTYALLILALPFAQLAVAGLGFVDSWFNLRSRLSSR